MPKPLPGPKKTQTGSLWKKPTSPSASNPHVTIFGCNAYVPISMLRSDPYPSYRKCGKIISMSVLTAPPSTSAARPPTSSRRGRLSMRNISKRFKNTSLSAVEDVTLECRPGEFVVVVGPSGCGKTTILTVAGGMITPDKGAIDVDD